MPGTGYKRVEHRLPGTCVVNSEIAQKFNGAIMTNAAESGGWNKADLAQVYSEPSTVVVAVTVAVADSGWGDAYTR